MVCFSKCKSNHLLGFVLIITKAGVLCQWSNDAQRFLLEHFDVIHSSPFQIYYFALPFSPPSSWLWKCYSAELQTAVRVVTGTPPRWGECSRTVSLSSIPLFVSCWDNNVAVCVDSGDTMILDAVTGSQIAVFSGHTHWVTCSTFSSDGILFVSGSYDETVKLWDVQTGGIIKIFCGHKDWVISVSISSNSAMIASGDYSGEIYIWDIQTGEPSCIIKHEKQVAQVIFSPTNIQHLISVSNRKIWQWDINGHQVGPIDNGSHIAFSSDGSCFVLCNGDAVTVQHSDTRATVAEFCVAGVNIKSCCFSPDGRLVAVAASNAIYVWSTTSMDSHPIEQFTTQGGNIVDLVFSSPSTLISASKDKSVRFWQTGVSQMGSVICNKESTPLTSAPIKSISLNPRNKIVISSDRDGIVKTWDISTGSCKASFQTPVGDNLRDVQLVDGKLISVWHESGKIHIWDTEKAKSLQTVEVLKCRSLKISADGSQIFCLDEWRIIEAWSIWTGVTTGKIEVESDYFTDRCYLNGSEIWTEFSPSSIQGWDFGTSGSSPVSSPNTSIEGLPLQFVIGPCHIINKITGKVVFQLYGRYAKPKVAQWDGKYLVAGYESGEVLVLDFSHLYPQQESVSYCLCDYNFF